MDEMEGIVPFFSEYEYEYEYEESSSTTQMFPLSSTELPDEIVIDILARLPVKALGRFRCVSKPWCSLIGDYPPFLDSQLKHASKSYIVVIPDPLSEDPCKLLCEKTCIEQGKLDSPYKIRKIWSPEKLYMVGPCNGTVALIDLDMIRGGLVNVHFWNPIIRHFKTVPPVRLHAGTPLDLTQCLVKFGLGYDDLTDDYKIVIFMYKYDDSTNLPRPLHPVQVYSTSTNGWTRIEEARGANAIPGLSLRSPAGHRGFIHWLAVKKSGSAGGERTLIMRFDVAKELFGEMGCPDCWDTKIHLAALGVVHDSLCAIVKPYPIVGGVVSNCDVWVMKEYGVVESWTKQYSVVFDTGISQIFGLTVNGKIMFSFKDDDDVVKQWLAVYDTQTSTYEIVGKYKFILLCEFISFTESLVKLF